MAITFRSAWVADIPALAAIRAREWETEAYWVERLSAYLGDETSTKQALAGRTMIVALDDTRLVGFIAGHRTRRFECDAELQWINVVPECRGAGIGAMLLLREIGAWFVEQSARRICVDVEPDNGVARRLYARCGAKPFKPYWMIWEDSHTMLSV